MDPFALPELDGILAMNSLETGSFGNNFNGEFDRDGNASFAFEADGGAVLLEFDTFDIDSTGEVLVLLNGEVIAHVDKGVNNGMSSDSVVLDDALLLDGLNLLEFQSASVPPPTWGVTNILLSSTPELQIDVYNLDSYGNGIGGQTDLDGVVTYHFESIGTDLTLYADGYDIDFLREVEVLVNGQSLGYMTVQDEAVENDLVLSTFHISADLLVSGTNTISFVQTGDPVRLTWGVSQVLLLGPGPYEIPAEFDPEFLGEYIIFQTDEAFILGKVDLDTGIYLGAVNISYIDPLDEYAINGPELMMTTEGIVGIGAGEDGLVVITPTEDYLIEGTEGLLVGYLPTGIVDGIRFNAIGSDFTSQYLVDDGVVTLLDLDGGTLGAWLNESEVTVNYAGTGIEMFAVYNVETGVLTEVTDNPYTQYTSKQDAFTTADGTQLIVISNGVAHDLWRNTGTGWEMVRTIRSPFAGLTYMSGVQFITWEGDTYITGLLTASPRGLVATPFLYDVDDNAWSLLSNPGTMLDTEIVILNNGAIAFHYYDVKDGKQEFFVVTIEEAMDAQVRGVYGGPIGGSFGRDRAAADSFVFQS